MRSWWKGALPGVLTFSLFAGACQDAPLAPRAPAMPATPRQTRSTYSGRQSDSLVAAVLAEWAKLGHPEYQREIDSWRRQHLGTTRPSELPDAPDPRATPPSALLSEGDGTLKNPPQVLSHREALHFGQNANGISLPTTLEGEMTFVGDEGRIAIGSFGITSKSGGTYTLTGELAAGAGQLVSCSDPTLGSCVNSKRLAGSTFASSAPYCDATGSGSLNYTAQNIQSTFDIATSPQTAVSSGGGVQDQFNVTQQLFATAPACDTQTGDTNTGGYVPPNPVDPYPPPEGWPDPGPEPYEPPGGGTPVQDDCVAFFSTLLLYVIVICSTD
jgi:hypothetical protein